MKEWLLFALFFVVGAGMLLAGIVYMRKEKGDLESAKIYRMVSIIGSVITIGSVLYKLLV